MLWWIWVVIGVALLGLEILTPGGFFIFFFGVAGIIVGLLTAAYPGLPLSAALLLYSALSIGLLLLFRERLLRLFAGRSTHNDFDSLQGSVCTAIDEINSNSFGKVEARGTVWSARNVGSSTVSKGERCIVRTVDGLLLHITREEQ